MRGETQRRKEGLARETEVRRRGREMDRLREKQTETKRRKEKKGEGREGKEKGRGENRGERNCK